MPDLTEILTPEAVRAWLDTLPDDATPCPSDGDSCPLMVYLEERGVIASVGVRSILVFESEQHQHRARDLRETQEVYEAPPWAVSFIELVDEQDNDPFPSPWDGLTVRDLRRYLDRAASA